MYRYLSKLVVYRNIEKDSVLFKLSDITRRFYAGDYNKEQLISEIYTEIHRLLDIATRYGFNDNLWHNYLAYLLATTENPFSMCCEKKGAGEGSVNNFAKGDFAIFKSLFDYDFSVIEKTLDINCFSVISNYISMPKAEQMYNKNVSEKIRALSAKIESCPDENGVFQAVTDFYRCYGVGMFGMNKAFRIKPGSECELEAITNTEVIRLSDLVGYELQKAELTENTEAFVKGQKANNVLLYGDAGTGKSTSIKAILNEYYDRGLRIIEIYKHQFEFLPKIIADIKNRNYRFIIYMDDLSFEENEIEYKYLKAVIEGGLEIRPENVLIYATSNRWHLIKETWSDRKDISVTNDVRHSDTMEEKLSLYDRFGCTINYSKPDQKDYFKIVTELAHRNNINMTDDEITAKARAWAMQHGGRSGRTAQQLINHLIGKENI
ncbi:MAG: ATP-binding protein [Ruminococcaceae bacterium]|nr:ATP-binding protein [Oscillospiraceae bacterium]